MASYASDGSVSFGTLTGGGSGTCGGGFGCGGVDSGSSGIGPHFPSNSLAISGFRTSPTISVRIAITII